MHSLFQLLQELCETFELDIPCRRKGPVFGVSRGNKEINFLHFVVFKIVFFQIKENFNSNLFYRDKAIA